MSDVLLTVNAGSSSVRLDLFQGGQRIKRSHIREVDADPRTTLGAFAEGAKPVHALAHRVVHGGTELSKACIITPQVEAQIRNAAGLAPLHNSAALAWIDASRQAFSADVVQVAAFDTAFYARLPEVARRYAIPKSLEVQHGIRRFGFHGLAHEAMLGRWQALAGERPGARTISLQLGSGCSVTAAQGGLAVDTSMGFTPLEGLVMATRGGDLDPGLVVYLAREQPLAKLEEMLNRSSGLMGIAGEPDMQRLLQRADADARAAVELYCYRARKYVGAYLAALGGADAILFGGGVGENAPEVRARILGGMAWCGVEIDEGVNRSVKGEGRVSANASRTEIWSIEVDEAALLAEKAQILLKGIE